MRESLMYGSVRGTRGNSRPYRNGRRQAKLARSAAEASAGANAAESVERRAGAKGNTHGKARTGLRARLACHRRWSVYGKQLPSHTRGGSRMRESRTRSGRGACDETHVPTATRLCCGAL
jgi:hypothetical protein